jgi:hypothetical protein
MRGTRFDTISSRSPQPFSGCRNIRELCAKNFAPVNCITLAGYGLRYFPSAELLCRVALQAFRRVDQRGRRCPFPAGQRRIERVLISARGLL